MSTLPNPRHERFAQELALGKSQSEAHIAAGYNGHRSNASKLARQAHIEARVKEIIAHHEHIIEVSAKTAAERLSLDAEWVLKRLMFNAERALRGKPILDSEGKHTGEFSGQIDAAAANKALELLGRHLYLFPSAVKVSGDPDAPLRHVYSHDLSKLSDDQLITFQDMLRKIAPPAVDEPTQH